MQLPHPDKQKIAEVKTRVQSFTEEFQRFALRGNGIQIAIGVIIGNAFNKIVTSFVKDIAMPPITALLGKVTVGDLKIRLVQPEYDRFGHIVRDAIDLQLGSFLQSVFDFFIIAFCIFAAIKAVNALYVRLEHRKLLPEELAQDKIDKGVTLLTEIRDLLKNSGAK